MEAHEIHEFGESIEKSAEEEDENTPHHKEAESHKSLLPVSFTMSVLAVLVAMTTVLGHRSHTEAVLLQAQASDQWNLYQAKKIRQNSVTLTTDLLSVLPISDKAAADKIVKDYTAHQDKWTDDLNEQQEKARELEADVRHQQHVANRFDFAEALLQIGVVIVSITLLTRNRGYWFLGMGFGAVGIVFVILGFLVH